MAHVSRKEYLVIFGILALLTVLEVGLVSMPVARGLMLSGLILMAVAKAMLVALFFMHLKHETRVLKLTVLLPLLLPPFYAVVLIAEAGWRLLA